MMKNNKVTLIGQIADKLVFSHEIYGNKFYNFKIDCRRPSGVIDTLPVTISEKIVNIKNLEKGLNVKLDAQLRTYNNYYHDGKQQNTKLKISIFVKDIEILDNDEDVNYKNEIYLNGFICKKPQYRETPRNRSICDLIIAVNYSYGKSAYIPSIAWENDAKFCNKEAKIGDNIKIWGKIQSREYDKKICDDITIKKVAYEVSISKMELNKDLNNRQN